MDPTKLDERLDIEELNAMVVRTLTDFQDRGFGPIETGQILMMSLASHAACCSEKENDEKTFTEFRKCVASARLILESAPCSQH